MMRHFFPVLCALSFAAAAHAQTPPKFEVDATWPKPLPEGWITGQLGGICVDARDNVIVVNRRDITAEEAETSVNAPPIIIFNPAGEVIGAFGDPNVVPKSIHGCFVDAANNIWVGGNSDAIVQKYSRDGKLLLQIGTKAVFDTADGQAKGPGLNASHERLYWPSAIAVDPGTGEIFISDGYGNRRVAVFDRDGKFLRQWGRQGSKEEAETGTPAVFSQIVHCLTFSNAGLVYVCDRQGDRIQVFDKAGAFKRNIWITPAGPVPLPDKRGSAWWVGFSPDREQKFMYVMNGGKERVEILDHASGKILGSFGRPGHQAGNFTHGHTLAVDSKGNIYVAETDWGRRVQKFRLVE
jgi:DNA-binding beta-propeller fold protein YncE